MTDIYHDAAYLALLRDILNNGHVKGDRTGTGTRSLFGKHLRFDLRQAFPLITTKKLPFRWIAEELFWFLSGSTTERELRDKGVDIWKEWATEEQSARFGRDEGDLGPIYGWQWRRFGALYRRLGQTDAEYYGARDVGSDVSGVDQIAQALELLDRSFESRRILVTAWNPRQATTVAIPPCHSLFQFEAHQEVAQRLSNEPVFTNADGQVIRRVLSCHMYQRSADVFLGVPFNIASYALLTHLVARTLNYVPGDLIISFGDVHIYNNHVKQVEEQLSRTARPSPTLRVPQLPRSPDCTSLDQLLSFQYGDLHLEGYDPHPKISAPVAV